MSWHHSISAERNGVSDDENFDDVGEKKAQLSMSEESIVVWPFGILVRSLHEVSDITVTSDGGRQWLASLE